MRFLSIATIYREAIRSSIQGHNCLTMEGGIILWRLPPHCPTLQRVVAQGDAASSIVNPSASPSIPLSPTHPDKLHAHRRCRRTVPGACQCERRRYVTYSRLDLRGARLQRRGSSGRSGHDNARFISRRKPAVTGSHLYVVYNSQP